MPSRLQSAVRADSVPFARIVRYALYAVAIFAVGLALAAVVGGFLDLFRLLLLQLRIPLVRLYVDGIDLLQRGIRVFALLVGIGVFLSQFERGS